MNVDIYRRAEAYLLSSSDISRGGISERGHFEDFVPGVSDFRWSFFSCENTCVELCRSAHRI